MNKRITAFIMLFILATMLFPANIFASTETGSTNFTYDEYTDLVAKGFIGEDVSYEILQQMQKESDALLKKLESSPDFIDITEGVMSGSVSMRNGDVLITNGTVLWGLTGHAAIAYSSTHILDIHNDYDKPQSLTVTQFKNRYLKLSSSWIKVYRCTDSAAATRAGNWANTTYVGSNAAYRITMDLSTTHETYCSKAVWQAYRYGAGPDFVLTGGTSGYALPYDLHFTIKHLSLQGDL